MDDNTITKSKPGVKSRFMNALRSKTSRTKLRKDPPPGYGVQTHKDFVKQDNLPPLPALPALPPTITPLQAHREKHRAAHTLVDSQLGERRDNTAILHSFGPRDSFESVTRDAQLPWKEPNKPGDDIIASLSPDLWQIIADYLTSSDRANLAFSSKTLRRFLGSKPWDDLRIEHPENLNDRIDFLVPMDGDLPNHLFCFICATYHLRTQRGQEKLKPPDVLNPLFNCPNVYSRAQPRARLTPSRFLPFSFLQLALRAHRYSPAYGIRLDLLSRRWKEGDWSHVTRYHIHKGHLLMRVVSTAFAPPNMPIVSKRFFLYSREDYTPYFSVCAHWRDGELMNVCKCALDHIPTSSQGNASPHAVGKKVKDRVYRAPNAAYAPVSLCEKCRPMRRCPECPTEYLFEIKLTEDKSDNTFKRAIIVTRWSDLGDESMAQEWKACIGEPGVSYDSFGNIGKRAISGIFESHFVPDHIPGQRILSLNPKNEKLGEEGHNWY